MNDDYDTAVRSDYGGYDADQLAASRPYETAFDKALKEVAVVREEVARLRDLIEPALQPELTEKAASEGSAPEPPKSPVVRDFDNLRYEIRKVSALVRSINDRVYL